MKNSTMKKRDTASNGSEIRRISMKNRLKIISGTVLLLVCGLLISVNASAGKKNTDTGEKCIGLECPDLEDTKIPDRPPSSTVWVANVETYGCIDLERNKIHIAVDWLSHHMNAIDGQMGRNSLLDWPGNSRENFEEKLEKTLKFHCINEKDKCNGLLGIAYPIVAQKRVNICANSIRDQADRLKIPRKALYVHVVAHEIGHLVHLNSHRSACADYYTNPRFSQSLGLAAEFAYRGLTYDASDAVDLFCSRPRTSSEDIIENKLKTPPIKVQQ